MPKEVAHIRQFHGGINDAAEATDISDIECQEAQNVDFSVVGKMTVQGNFQGTGIANTGITASPAVGEGFFTFRSDRNKNGANNTCNYIVVNHNNSIKVYEDNTTTALEITSSSEWGTSSGVEANYLFHNGVLRQCDGQLIAANQRRWWGYINRTHFGNTSNAREDAYSANMRGHDADLATPAAGAIVTNDTTFTDGSVNFRTDIGGSGGSIAAADYNIAYSFVYDDHQESLLKEFSSSPVTITAGQYFGGGGDHIKLYFHTLNSRIVGTRIYVKRDDTTDDWTLLLDVDLIKGARQNFNDIHEANWGGGADEVMFTVPFNIKRLGPNTYRSINGHAFDENIDCSYKSAVVVDGVTYAGNFLQNGIKYPDRVIKSSISPPFGICPDKFPESNFIPVTPNDGDEIVKLETFADKVLVFKRKSLFVVNYSPDMGDYLDATFPFMGIRKMSHSFPTAHGIVFMNDLGVHLYDGTKVVTLTGKMNDMSIAGFSSTAGGADLPIPEQGVTVEPPENPPPSTSGDLDTSDMNTSNSGGNTPNNNQGVF
tara:strand:+ start:8191 stop:9816 length:1626 start_codon:yes stop_codon:yes gene_type:complete